MLVNVTDKLIRDVMENDRIECKLIDFSVFALYPPIPNDLLQNPSKRHENPTLFGVFPGSQVHIREAVVDKKVPKNR